MRKLFLFLIIACPCWANWAKIYTVQVDRTKMGSSNLTDFPVLISASDNSLKDTGHGGNVTNSNGYDIVVATSGAITTYVPFELEFWDNVNGIIVMWAKLSSVNGSGAGSNTTFYVAWGNSSITTQQNTGSYAPANVWDSNFVAVFHLGNGTTLNVNDSTSNANNGTNHSATATTGKVDGGANLPVNDYIDYGSTGMPTGAASFTLECWLSATLSGSYEIALALGDMSIALRGVAISQHTSVVGGGIAGHIFDSSLGASALHHVVVTYDGTNQRVYGDGSLFAGPTALSANIQTTCHRIGDSCLGEWIRGSVDEARISTTARSADWILSEYNNMANPGNIASANFLIWSTFTQSTIGFPMVL